MSRYKYDAKQDRFLVYDDDKGTWKPAKKTKGRPLTGAPSFLPDIKPFIAHATEQPVEITSRSKLRAYERSNNIVQAGDYKPGEIISRVKQRNERDMQEASRLTRETRLRAKEHFKWL